MSRAETSASHDWAARTRSRVAALPAWLWLAVIVLLSAGIRLAMAKPHPAPWIFGDELVYANLARSFADSAAFSVQGVPGFHGYGPGYPLLISPAFFLFDNLAHAYAAAKAINALVMSLAAVPAYLIARRFVAMPLALLAAVLTLAIPSLLFVGTMMTENAFYPAFLLCTLAMLAALERPTVWRQLLALGLVAGAYAIRAQAVALVLAFVTAIVLVSLVESRIEGRWAARDIGRRLAAFWPTWAVLAAAPVLVFLAELARGRSPRGIVGGYYGLVEFDYSATAVARWFVLHLAEIDLYLGIIPFAALLVLGIECFRRGVLSRSLRLFGLLCVALTLWMAVIVAAAASYFASDGGPGRIEERNFFYIAPLALIALVVWVGRDELRSWPSAGLAALAAVALPGAISYDDFANLSALSDTFLMVPFWNLVYFQHIQATSLPVLIMAGSLLGGGLFLALPRRFALLAPALVLAWFALLQVSLARQIEGTSHGVLTQGVGVRREWVDEAVPEDAQVAFVWSGTSNRMTVLQNEFFNRSVSPVYSLRDTAIGELPLPHQRVTVDEQTGALRTNDGRPVRSTYVLADGAIELSGRQVTSDPTLGTMLYQVPGEVRLARRFVGVYPDSWTGPEATYTRWGCRGGKFELGVMTQPGLLAEAQTVTAVSGGKVVGRARVAPTGEEATLVLPLLPRRNRCELRLRVTPTAVPAQLLGTSDTRELGVLLTKTIYEPPGAG